VLGSSRAAGADRATAARRVRVLVVVFMVQVEGRDSPGIVGGNT
jgi:hypothetical protein